MQPLDWLHQWPKKKLYYGLAAVGLGLCIFTGALWKQDKKPTDFTSDILFVTTAVIGAANAAQEYTYSGEVRGRYESQLSFQVSGKIIKRNIELGSIVQPGDILMQIDAKDIQQTVNSSSAQVYSAQSQLNLAESNLSRYRQLYAQNAISRAQLDQYENAYQVAQAAVQQASAQYAQGSNQLDYSLLRADKPGIVSHIAAEAGQVIGAGQTAVTIVQDGDREVEIHVPENRIEELRHARQLTTTFWALPDITVNSSIREIAPMADQTTRTFKVRIRLINPPPDVKLGMTTSVTVPGTVQQTVTIPLAAVYQTGTTPSVWVVKDNVLTLRPVQIGAFGNGTIQVLSGLDQGEQIVIAGVHKLKEGQQVRTGGNSL
ncbi:efflux RND transporter periplasmic adaptor subunit [Sporomusa acidovorans]|uniref:Multidrug resistance protein MdtE n=1 Tax=Sporomusa acidovorans (strain ATCC 49682 / DSM 3132 / Mol) TaxID=1123286 RepID=A0ABZ3IYG3_SPOA4|nr:efflux RND transporter periplasmic adaptor subunit [Sporomusa acidovorans]OZC16943.1 multidrug resistance protein MdtE precursor [Sporomusa acidovorans DSM 3132]SDE13367.1 RND family efflux transporter, MFP subunit [Sporomusa acidovorans]